MQSRLASGELSQRVTILSATVTQDAAGQPKRTWAAITGGSSLPAKVESVTGGETVRGRQVTAGAVLLVTVRYRTGITTKMQLTYESGTYGIVRVSDPYGDRRELRIECKA